MKLKVGVYSFPAFVNGKVLVTHNLTPLLLRWALEEIVEFCLTLPKACS